MEQKNLEICINHTPSYIHFFNNKGTKDAFPSRTTIPRQVYIGKFMYNAWQTAPS